MAAKPNEKGVVVPSAKRALTVKVSPAAIDRAMRIMDALMKALDQRSYAVKTNNDAKGRTAIIVDDETVYFSLLEDTEKIAREPTEQEKLDHKRYPSLYRGPYYAWRPTGNLRISIEDARRVKWGDGKKRRLEDCLNDVVAGFVHTAEHIRLKRVEMQEWQLRWKEEQRLLAIEQEEIAAEEEKVKALEEEVKQWTWAQQIRQYLKAIRAASKQNGEKIEAGSEMAEWLKWAEAQADRADPLKESPQSVLDDDDEADC